MGRLRGLFFKEGFESDAAIYPIDRGGNMMWVVVRREGQHRIPLSSPAQAGDPVSTDL
jgi:hypothetical protein